MLLYTSLVFLKIPACLYNSTMHSPRFLFLLRFKYGKQYGIGAGNPANLLGSFSNDDGDGKKINTSHEYKHLRNCDYFAIISSCLHFNEEPCNWISPSAVNTLKINGCTQVFINTVNVVISRCCFAEDGTDLFIRACRTWSTIIFPRSTNQILNLRRCLCRSRR